MLRILEHIASPGSSEFRAGAVNEFLANVPPSRLGTKGRDAVGQIIVKFRRDLTKHPQMLPRLKTLFSIAASWGTTPLDILLRPKEAASPSMFDGSTFVPKSRPKRPFKKRAYDACEKRLRDLMDLPVGILLPSVNAVCREFEVSRSNFWKSRTEIWEAYTFERAQRLKEHKERSVELAISYMEKHIARLQQSGERLHRRNTIRQMILDIRVPTAVARSTLRLSLLQMRMRRDDAAKLTN